MDTPYNTNFEAWQSIMLGYLPLMAAFFAGSGRQKWAMATYCVAHGPAHGLFAATFYFLGTSEYMWAFGCFAVSLSLGIMERLYQRVKNKKKEDSKKKDEDSKMGKNKDNRLDSGYWLRPDQDNQILSNGIICPYCERETPMELLVSYPCCGYRICLMCFSKNTTFCGECLTDLPSDTNAFVWLNNRLEQSREGKGRVHLGEDHHYHLIGRSLVWGSDTRLDELIALPLFQRIEPPPLYLALMNPPNIQGGVLRLEVAAKKTVIPAMLDLADIYNTDFQNDPFEKDKEKAEYWFRRALGHGNKIFPLAFTRYGLFLLWERKFQEAKHMFRVAAEYGHGRGQYEYAQFFLGERPPTSSSSASERNSQQSIHQDGQQKNEEDKDVPEAIRWLCRASHRGFYVPANLQLAKTLIELAEEAYASAYETGFSPLPRALQILTDIDEDSYGYSPSLHDEIVTIQKRYDCCASRCANCGKGGSDESPLAFCSGCGVIAYCSRICQRRHFRDGHKYDCCSREALYEYELIKLTLPGVWNGFGKRNVLHFTPGLSSSGQRSLIDMVEDDTEEIHGEDELEYDEHWMIQQVLRMRQNLETWLDRQLKSLGTKPKLLKDTLAKRIETFSKADHVTEDLIDSIHEIRHYGNKAAHASPDDPPMDRAEYTRILAQYRDLKKEYEEKVTKARLASVST